MSSNTISIPKIIHLQVNAGFANRLRAMISGICLAEDLKIPIVIHWTSLHPACACNIQLIFDMKTFPSFVSFSSSDLWKPISCSSNEDLQDILNNNTKSELLLSSHGHFHTTNHKRWLFHLRNLKPHPIIQKEIYKRLHNIDMEKAIGFHIRRGDNVKSIQYSPTEKFIEIAKENDKDNVKFIIATDDNGVKTELEQCLGKDKCVFPAQERNRNSIEGIVEAVIDFFSIAKCSVLYGSYYSSFSEMVVKYGDSKLIVVV